MESHRSIISLVSLIATLPLLGYGAIILLEPKHNINIAIKTISFWNGYTVASNIHFLLYKLELIKVISIPWLNEIVYYLLSFLTGFGCLGLSVYRPKIGIYFIAFFCGFSLAEMNLYFVKDVLLVLGIKTSFGFFAMTIYFIRPPCLYIYIVWSGAILIMLFPQELLIGLLVFNEDRILPTESEQKAFYCGNTIATFLIFFASLLEGNSSSSDRQSEIPLISL